MNVIPFAKFILAVLFAGIMMFVFFPVMDMISAYFPDMISADAGIILFAIWNGIPFIVLVKETIQVLMSMQRRNYA